MTLPTHSAIPITATPTLLRMLRRAAGLSRREVGRRAGMSADTVRRCEEGANVRIDKPMRFAEACGVPLVFEFVPREAR